MNRFNLVRNTAEPTSFLAWGKTTGALVFAALLIACSLTVGCSSEKPKTVTSNNPSPITQSPSPTLSSNLSAPAPQVDSKPVPKKVVRKRPATVNYSDKTYGVSFEYPRKYAIETGDAAASLVASSSMPMNFVVPGGVALAAVELPETGYSETDFSSAYFNVSVNKALTEEQCTQFAVPQPSAPAPADSGVQLAAKPSKLMLGDMALLGTEAVAGEGSRQSDVKYFHAFQNGACYEFALNVTTMARPNEGGLKHVDRDKVFSRLEKILATVKINPLADAPEATTSASETPAASPAAETPAATEVPSTTETPAAQDASPAVTAPAVSENKPQ
jgi:hypothetical protein